MQRPHALRTCALLGLAALGLAGPARAQQPASPSPGSPALPSPAESSASPPGSSPDATGPAAPPPPLSVAAALFAEGAGLFKQWRFDEAEQKFRAALTHEDRPLIRLYLSRVLDKQGRLVEAHATLLEALRPGVAGLPPEDVQVAEDLQASLESRLAQLEVHCDLPGARVYLDGAPWFTAPARPRRMINAGQHVLIARKPGYFPVAESVSLIPGKQTRVVLRMTADVMHVERRWQPWQPWAVAGAGMALSLGGGLFLRQASHDYAAIQRQLDACAGGETSCDRISTTRLDHGESRSRIGAGALITGGALVAAGLVGVFLNLPRTWRSEPGRGVEDLDIAPMVSGDGAGLSARIRF